MCQKEEIKNLLFFLFVREGLKLIVGEVSEDILNELVNEADVNQDGEITYDEFEALLMTSWEEAKKHEAGKKYCNLKEFAPCYFFQCNKLSLALSLEKKKTNTKFPVVLHLLLNFNFFK